MNYKGSCHCSAIKFEFTSPSIEEGLRCNCSICRRKGALMTPFNVAPNELKITSDSGALATYEFGSCVAKHHFCSKCGIYPFHQSMRKPGHYRFNIGCIEGINSFSLPFKVFDGESLWCNLIKQGTICRKKTRHGFTTLRLAHPKLRRYICEIIQCH